VGHNYGTNAWIVGDKIREWLDRVIIRGGGLYRNAGLGCGERVDNY
jgi:hypothetical protein